MADVSLFDCDTHCSEPRDAFTRYLPDRVRGPRHHAGAQRQG